MRRAIRLPSSWQSLEFKPPLVQLNARNLYAWNPQRVVWDLKFVRRLQAVMYSYSQQPFAVSGLGLAKRLACTIANPLAEMKNTVADNIYAFSQKTIHFGGVCNREYWPKTKTDSSNKVCRW